jgi:FMN reductase
MASNKIEKADEILIVGLCGSFNPNGATRRAMDVALDGARATGARIEVVDLGEWTLPFAGSRFTSGEFPDVERLQALVRSAHGVVWATPEYHGSYSGALKNALDLLGFDEFSGKMVGLVGTAGGSIGAINALSHLRAVGRQLHAWVLPQQVSVASASRAFGEDGRPVDARVEKRLRDLGRDLARFSFLHTQADDAFLKLWEATRPEDTAPTAI